VVSDIGIKIANGDFYPILEENSTVKKRLIVTTVHNNQQSVQIDLYKSYTRTMVDALYIGSLIMEDIKPRPKGEPSIELIIASTRNGEISAEAVDLDTSVKGEHQTLTVSLKSLEEENLGADLPDYELEQNEPPPTGLLEKASRARAEGRKGFPWLLVAGVALLLAAIGVTLWFFLLRDTGVPALVQQQPPAAEAPVAQPPAPPPPPAPAPVAVTPAPAPAAPAPAAVTPPAPAPAAPPAPPPAPPPVITAPAAPPPAPAAAAQGRNPPVASFNIPAVIPREGVPYLIRYGDTLWDIADAFYRNPFLYPHIARFNNIPNPNLIISGTIIRVPPRN